MKSFSLITLFAPMPAPPKRDAAASLGSLLAHAAGCVWIFYGLSHTPRLEAKATVQRYNVRVLEMPMPEPPAPEVPRAPRSPGSSAAHAAPQQPAPELAAQEAPAPMPSAAAQLAKLVHQHQMLIQPDAPPDVLLQQKTPIPTLSIWAPVNIPVKPTIQQTQKPVLTRLRHSADMPNREVAVTDLRLAASNTPDLRALRAGTTSPVVVMAPEAPKPLMPQTILRPTEQPAAARIMSISDFQSQEGPVVVPLANATPRPLLSNSNSMGAGRAASPVNSTHGSAPTTEPGTSMAQTQPVTSVGAASTQASGTSPNKAAAGTAATHAAAAGSGPGAGTGRGAGTGPGAAPGPVQTGPIQAASAGSGIAPALQGPVTRINLPKDGQFGVVVVGSSLAEQYPEIVNIWGGRLVYSVYLHVGGGKKWILQYTLPPGAQAPGGSRPDAPWPFDIVRPRFDAEDYNSDALMVHGFVNATGKFEHLALVFPADFAKVKFLLSALQQWEFRPARENGQVASVEVLLIIPEESQ